MRLNFKSGFTTLVDSSDGQTTIRFQTTTDTGKLRWVELVFKSEEELTEFLCSSCSVQPRK